MLANIFKNFILLFILGINFWSFSAKSQPTSNQATSNKSTDYAQMENLVDKRTKKEEQVFANPFGIVFYKPTYILPYYYTGSPYNTVYVNSTPNNEKINRGEFKYQLSLKAPIWKNIFNYPLSLYLAYTQLSYWQLYNKTAFFRETDYEPELFLSSEINLNILDSFKLNFVNLGVDHQSNGFGNQLERSWNRVYLEFISSGDNWMLSVKPWYVLHDSTMRTYNPDIANYLGHGQVTFAYKYNKKGVISLQAYNFIESGARRPSAELTLSHPINPYLKAYVQIFSGYGQSLIEYNHRTNSIGVGITLNDWI